MVNSSSSLAISCVTSPKTRGFGKSYKKISGHWTVRTAMTPRAKPSISGPVKYQESFARNLHQQLFLTFVTELLISSQHKFATSTDYNVIYRESMSTQKRSPGFWCVLGLPNSESGATHFEVKPED